MISALVRRLSPTAQTKALVRRTLASVLTAFLAGCAGGSERGSADSVAVAAADALAAAARSANAREQALTPAPASRPRPAPVGRGFRSPRQLQEHVEKHGAEFGTTDAAEYLRLARALRDTAVGGPILELARADGVITRYDRGSGAFIAFDDDGTIRTFFRPNDGETYFRRQARRRPSR